MGVNSFPDDIVKWMKGHLPTFYEVDTDSRSQWLKQIAEHLISEFHLPTENDSRTLADYRRDIMRWFRNKNNDGAKRKYHKPQLISPQKQTKTSTKGGKAQLPGFVIPQVPAPRTLYGQVQSNTSRITAITKERHNLDPTVPYVKQWNNVLSEQWNQLSDEERRVYQEEYQNKKTKLLERPSEADIYANQANLLNALPKSLQDLVGFEKPYQHGNLLLHVQGVYRGQEDKLNSFSFVVYPPGVQPLLVQDEYEQLPGYNAITIPWQDYARKILPATAYPRDDLSTNTKSTYSHFNFTYDVEGSPLLPTGPFNPPDLVAILSQYIMETWKHHWSRHEDKITFSWDQFVLKPEVYMQASCIPADVIIDEPQKMELDDVQTWYNHLLQLQKRRLELGEPQTVFRGQYHLLGLQSKDQPTCLTTQELERAPTFHNRPGLMASTPIQPLSPDLHPTLSFARSPSRALLPQQSISQMETMALLPSEEMTTPITMEEPAIINKLDPSVSATSVIPEPSSGEISVIDECDISLSRTVVDDGNEDAVDVSSGGEPPPNAVQPPAQAQCHAENDSNIITGEKRKRYDKPEGLESVGKITKRSKKSAKPLERPNTTGSDTPIPRRSNRPPKLRTTGNLTDISPNSTAGSPAPIIGDVGIPDQHANLNQQSEPRRAGRPRGHRQTWG